jgi:hypothetical protein
MPPKIAIKSIKQEYQVYERQAEEDIIGGASSGLRSDCACMPCSLSKLLVKRQREGHDKGTQARAINQ